MNQATNVAGAFSCHRCDRAVRVRVDGAVGVWQCVHCGSRNPVRTHAIGGNRTRIEIESGGETVFGPNYGFE